jgi:hypothetical protein
MASKIYSPTTWVNGSQPAISAENLNHIENGIDAIDNRVVTHDGDIADLQSAVQTATDAQIAAIVAKIRGLQQ